MGFKQLSLFILFVMIFSILIAFAFDYISVFVMYDDVRIQTYIGGFYVAGMAANPAALAYGDGYTGEMYEDADIYEAFQEFSKGSFEPMSKKHSAPKTMYGKQHIKYDVEKGVINSVITSCEILNVSGVKGVAITVEYRVDPKLNALIPEGVPTRLPYYRVALTRRFRLLGQ